MMPKPQNLPPRPGYFPAFRFAASGPLPAPSSAKHGHGRGGLPGVRVGAGVAARRQRRLFSLPPCGSHEKTPIAPCPAKPQKCPRRCLLSSHSERFCVGLQALRSR